MFDSVSHENIEFLQSCLDAFQRDEKALDSSWKDVFTPYQNEDQTQYATSKECEVNTLVHTFRVSSHLWARFYPEAIAKPMPMPHFSQMAEGLYPTFGLLQDPYAPYEAIVRQLTLLYTSRIGYEFWPFCDEKARYWLAEKIEKEVALSQNIDQKLFILQKLAASEVLETFLHTRYVGQKRFSLEGAETLIPMLAAIVEKSDADDIIIGMPHRGRINILVNILNKTYQEIFSEFEDIQTRYEGSGDVKYHKGYSSKTTRQNGKEVRLWLAANPSHLESVDPVVEGISRAKTGSLPVLIHGDAAVSGQGVVYETLQLARLSGYTTGGTIHIVINNHIGFTTLPEDARSTHYPTDIAKTFSAPVLHVNAEDPESCIDAIFLALEYRNTFHTDIFIDLNCFRKYGHNEGDEPAFTQPLLYSVIRQKPSIRSIYHDRLVQENVVLQEEIDRIDTRYKEDLHTAFQEVKNNQKSKPSFEIGSRKIEEHEAFFEQVDTAVDIETLKQQVSILTGIPEGFTLHPRLQKQILETKNEIAKDFLEYLADWSFAESLALATLLHEGCRIRFSGQDSRRGTFSQRHGMWVDQESEKSYFPLQSCGQTPEQFELVNSLLSENAALGFEYGYSLAATNALVIWEAQFGDFVNGAQVIIDQYIASGEQKWQAKSRLTLFLPHGYEGEGPEHSSARMERFLTLCANDNMFVVHPTTPSQFFHLIRRQHHMKKPKPLVVFTPKGLLRNPKCKSKVLDFTTGHFEEVLDDPEHPITASKIIFCQGRVYYDLVSHKTPHYAIIRIEQLYPFHAKKIESILESYPHAESFYWVQEEPINMGAWSFIKESLERLLPRNCKLEYRGRQASASPAVGSHKVHDNELQCILQAVFFQES